MASTCVVGIANTRRKNAYTLFASLDDRGRGSVGNRVVSIAAMRTSAATIHRLSLRHQLSALCEHSISAFSMRCHRIGQECSPYASLMIKLSRSKVKNRNIRVVRLGQMQALVRVQNTACPRWREHAEMHPVVFPRVRWRICLFIARSVLRTIFKIFRHTLRDGSHYPGW